jgi:hypothetical protein
MLQVKKKGVEERERSTQNANIVIPAQIAKQKPSLMRKQKPKKQETCRRPDAILQKNEALKMKS